MVNVPYRSFAGGEISPKLAARVDQVKYQTGLWKCRNFISLLEGAAHNRTGTGFVAPLLEYANTNPRLIPFIYNDEQAYVLALHFTDPYTYALVIRNGGVVTETPKALEGATNANPCVITITGHGYSTNDLLYLAPGSGMPQLSGRWVRAVHINANTFSITEEDGNPIDSTGYDPFTLGPGMQTAARAVTVGAFSYGEGDLRRIRYKQSGDTLILTHDGFPTMVVQRISETVWSVAPGVFDTNIDAPENGALSGSAGADTVRYRVTAVDEDTLEESFPGYESARSFASLQLNNNNSVVVTTTVNHLYNTGDFVRFQNIVDSAFDDLNGLEFEVTVTSPTAFRIRGAAGVNVYTAAAPAGEVARDHFYATNIDLPDVNPITVSWDPVPGALEYNIYREINGIFGYIGTSATTSFVDKGYDIDPFDTPPIDLSVFGEAGDYPLAVAWYQQSLVLAGSINDPERSRKSRSGLFWNFTKSNPIQANDSFSWITVSNQRNNILHFLDMGKLLVFTLGAVFSIEGDESGSLTPTGVNARLRAEFGSGDVEPIALVDIALMVQSSGRVIRELIPDTGERYQANDVTVYARHLFTGKRVVSWSYAEEPTSIVWCVRNDGSMIGMTYLRKHEVHGWHRHDTGDGDEFLDVCCIPENHETAVYLAVRRYECHGRTRVYIERMASRSEIETADDGRFFDCHASYDGRNTDEGNTYELSFDDTYESEDTFWIAPTGGTSPFDEGVDSDDIGNAVVFTLDDGTFIRCTIVEVYNGYAARVTIEGDTDSLTLPYESSSWSYAVDEVGGLWHLEGREVYGVADNGPIGPFTVENGMVSLGETFSRIVIGLRIIADAVTLEPESPEGESWANKAKTVGQVTVRVENTDGLQVGLSESSLQAWNSRNCKPDEADGETPQEEGELYTGRIIVENEAALSYAARVHLRQSSGLPTTVLAVYAEIEPGE